MVSKFLEMGRVEIADVYAFPANADVSIQVNDDYYVELVTAAIDACAPATLAAIFDYENDFDYFYFD